MKQALISFVALALGGSAFAVTTPNLFECSHDGLKVGYATSGFDGKPSLTLEQNGQSRSFHGQEIRTQSTVAGTLVTVTEQVIPDYATDLFTLIVPSIHLSAQTPVLDFHTSVAHTKALTSIGGPQLVQGVINPTTYEGVECKAQSVMF